MTKYAYSEDDFIYGHGPTLYRGLSRSTSSPVLIKRVIGGAAAKRKLESCDKEVSYLKLLKHPGIPRLTDSFAHRLDFYLIFEGKSFHSLKEECDFREATTGSRALEPDEIQGLFFQLLDILDFAHSKGITHSKLEPDNILWYADDDGRIKLIDFKAMDDVDDDPETDMLAFGTTIFYLATGTTITEVRVTGVLGWRPSVGTVDPPTSLPHSSPPPSPPAIAPWVDVRIWSGTTATACRSSTERSTTRSAPKPR
jgi:serine/threonine protein kinase